MPKDKLQKAIEFASNNPKSEFAFELRNRINSGEFNDTLKEQGINTDKFKVDKPSFLKSVGKGLIKSETEFGKSIAGAIDVFTGAGGGERFEEAQSQDAKTTSQILGAIREKKGRGEDTSKLENLLKDMSGVFKNDLLERQAELTTGKVLGQAGGVALDVLGFGTIGSKATKIVTTPTKILSGAARGAGEGAKVGGFFGAGQGFVRGLQEGREGADLLSETISGGLVGAAAGGVLGGVTGGVSGGLRGKALRKQQLTDELTNNPELVAKFDLTDTGKIAKDPTVKEVLRQGLPEKQVAVVKNATPTDKAKFKEMFSLAEKASKDAKAVERPSDIVGNTIVKRTKHLFGQVQKAGKEVDEAAKSLAGQKADPTPAAQLFIDDLGEMGITFKKGKAVFDGSDVQGIKPAEDLINKVVQRMENVTDDALQLHKLKKFIDEQVTFGKAGEGLTGQTERVMKALRANIDNILDTKFANYNAANTAFSKSIRILDDTKTVLGKNFNPNSGDIRAGSIARRILGNSANRGDILEYLKTLEAFVKETGGDVSDDIIAQTVFADILEDVFGTQATTGLSGQVARGVEQAGGVVQDIGQGQLITGLTRAGVRTFQSLRGITDEAKIKALGELIGI